MKVPPGFRERVLSDDEIKTMGLRAIRDNDEPLVMLISEVMECRRHAMAQTDGTTTERE